MTDSNPVLIIGAGINGCALARELALNGVPVWIVDEYDIGSGATSRSSRLIHGGLRYLEYGEFRLVRESLEERRRLLKLAPHFVRPLRLHIPVSHRTGGIWSSVVRFLSSLRIPLRSRLLSRLLSRVRTRGSRGLWLVRVGLRIYDWFARDPDVPSSSVQSVTNASVPQVNRRLYRWLCDYTDAQMQYPERFTLAMLEDARRLAVENEVEFHVETHATARNEGLAWQITTKDGDVHRIAPSAVVNATGAWGDFTLAELGVKTPRLLGGTRGSHFVVFDARLRESLRGAGVYAETADGRLVFILPFVEGVLVGTTDERFSERPNLAVATEDELGYLTDLVNEVMPDASISRDDIAVHYSGVRPLPYQESGRTASISRDHTIHQHDDCPVPTMTLVGGKLTTCRAFAERVADRLLEAIGMTRQRSSRDLKFASNEGYPRSDDELESRLNDISSLHQIPIAVVRSIWDLLGTRSDCFLDWIGQLDRAERDRMLNPLDGSTMPSGLAYWAIDREWARTLDDLVERRLMLVFSLQITRGCLRRLAVCLVDRGYLASESVETAVESTIQRLKRCYGRTIER